MTEFRSLTDTGIPDDEPPATKLGAYVDRVCKLGMGQSCCRYLAAGPSGLECLKLTPLKRAIDERFAAGRMVASGDNCDGLTSDVMRSSD